MTEQERQTKECMAISMATRTTPVRPRTIIWPPSEVEIPGARPARANAIIYLSAPGFSAVCSTLLTHHITLTIEESKGQRLLAADRGDPSRELIFLPRGNYLHLTVTDTGLPLMDDRKSAMPPSLPVSSYPRRGRLASRQSLESTTARCIYAIP